MEWTGTDQNKTEVRREIGVTEYIVHSEHDNLPFPVRGHFFLCLWSLIMLLEVCGNQLFCSWVDAQSQLCECHCLRGILLVLHAFEGEQHALIGFFFQLWVKISSLNVVLNTLRHIDQQCRGMFPLQLASLTFHLNISLRCVQMDLWFCAFKTKSCISAGKDTLWKHRAEFLKAIYFRQSVTCTVGLTNDSIDGGQPRAVCVKWSQITFGHCLSSVWLTQECFFFNYFF